MRGRNWWKGGRGRGEKNTLSLLSPRSLWLAPFPPLFGKFQHGAFASKHIWATEENACPASKVFSAGTTQKGVFNLLSNWILRIFLYMVNHQNPNVNFWIENVTVKKTFAGTDQTTWNRVYLRYFDWQLNSISRCLISPWKSLLDCNVFNLIYFDCWRPFWIRRWARLIVHGFCSGFLP